MTPQDSNARHLYIMLAMSHAYAHIDPIYFMQELSNIELDDDDFWITVRHDIPDDIRLRIAGQIRHLAPSAERDVLNHQVAELGEMQSMTFTSAPFGLN